MTAPAVETVQSIIQDFIFETIVFQEKGMRPLEGILYAVQANPRVFTDRATLPRDVVAEVRRRHWEPAQQNALFLDWDAGLSADAGIYMESLLAEGIEVTGRFFHIRVRNGHNHKTARNAFAYIERLVDLASGQMVPFESVELKWAGYRLPNGTIPPRGYRKLDAVWIPHPGATHPHVGPNNPQFNTFADSTQFVPHIAGPGAWELTYSVICDTMPGAQRTFRLQLDGTLDGARFEPVN